MADFVLSSEYTGYDQFVCCVGILRQTLTAQTLPPAFQAQQGHPLARVRWHDSMRVLLLGQYYQQLCVVFAKTRPARR